MTDNEWMELAVLERKKYTSLLEIQDVTRQLAESLDRNDQVSVRMLIAMRQDPLLQLEEVDRGGKVRLAALTEEDRRRASFLREGGEPGSSGETTFAEQAGRTRRLLEEVVELDRRVSLRMAGEHSFYSDKK